MLVNYPCFTLSTKIKLSASGMICYPVLCVELSKNTDKYDND